MTKLVTYDCPNLSGESDLSLAEMLDLFDHMEWSGGAFAHFPIDKRFIFQIIHNKGGGYTAEFTDTIDIVFYQKRVNKAECRDMIIAFFEKQSITPNMLDGFEKEKEDKTIYDSVKGSLKKKILFWIILSGFYSFISFSYLPFDIEFISIC